ncbi:MAG: methyl-accepting chemotaxis protein [Xenococcaceae cyanobacterium MO_234.B1]|nr:methyl-accepting chemotaxis protein [Xenococcaceae cyanobacterium MO_234.B1]
MKLPLFKSLQFRLPFLVLLGIIPTTIIAIAFASSNASNIIRQETEENLALKAKALNTSISRWTEMNVLALQNLSKQPDIVSMEPKRQKPVLMAALNNYQHLYTASTTDLNGINVTRSDDKAPKKYPDRPWFQGAKAGNDITYQTLIGRTSKKPSLCLSAPIKAKTIIKGVTYICMTLEILTEEVGAVKFGKTGYGFIVNEQGRILGHPDTNLTSGDELIDYSSYPPVANFLAGKEGYFSFKDQGGIEWLSHGTRLNNGWGVFILQQKSEAFLKEKEFQQLAAMIAGISILAVGIITWLLASRLTQPISKITEAATSLAAGNLDQKVALEQEDEIGILADSFNKMAQRLQESITSIESKAEEQRQEKEQLEAAIYTLIDEVSGATEGDLTVRANLDSMELSTVADLFNAIIDNLEEIAVEAKQSTTQVGSSLKQNEEAIRLLAEQAIVEAKETRDTLISVEQMSQSIQAVAENASQAEAIADDTYNTVLNSTNDMDLTVDSILALRTTVGETAKKIKRLGESSQKISQAVSFIEEIALKTNVLAINASVEAGRAGEYGQGFTIVAEQVGALAEQSAAATKEIANIVAEIQAETKEVNQAMESGTAQVVETTRLVESTKQSLGQVLEKSQEINQLMGSISQTTVSQANTSQSVTSLMQKIANLSETTSISSKEVAQSMVETAQVAAKLESTVAQFKVAN